jgi:ankyrin repeat protein
VSSLPARPSLESLRKQAKKRARATNVSLREAQLALARDYGFAGWNDLVREVHARLGTSLEWAQAQARRFVHDNAVAELSQLVADVPALLAWDGLVELATSSFGDSFDPERERRFTRSACAELLIDAGAVVAPRVCDALIEARARGLLQLFERKGLLPRTLRFAAALGDLERVRSGLAADLATVNEALRVACRLEHPAVAEVLLDRALALDPELGARIDRGPGRAAFVAYLIRERALEFIYAAPSGPWQAYVMNRVASAIANGDLAGFQSMLADDPALLGDACVGFQVGLVERATLRDRADFLTAIIDLAPALARRPKTHAIEFALTYAKPHLVPLLNRIWPTPEDLPHAAGMGDLARVQRWFDASGEPALGDLAQHVPCNDPQRLRDLEWGAPTVQHVLDTALGWAVVNNHFEVADFLLAHGADIDTTWSSHEPASILHELAGSYENYAAMEFVIARGIDMTRLDHRWNATAEGWARHAAGNARVADWLHSRTPA